MRQSSEWQRSSLGMQRIKVAAKTMLDLSATSYGEAILVGLGQIV
jgi:hypothetical protein